jgi:hypothetical protein
VLHGEHGGSGAGGGTDLEIDVLNVVLSRRTVEHHVQDIYLKIGASTRAGGRARR